MNKSFNCDIFAQNRVLELIKDKNIQTFVETGTYIGETAAEMAKIVSEVITFELSEERYLQSKTNLAPFSNIKLYCCDSVKWLNDNLKQLDLGPTFFFLDAHWFDYWPVRDELKAIAESKKHTNSVIMIHDFQVPDNNTLGFDSYNNQPLNYDYVKDVLQLVWPQGYKVEYNNQAVGGNRGIGYFYN